MVKDGRFIAIARGLAGFAGAFALLNVIAALRTPGFDANLWWIDLRPIPLAVALPLTALLAAGLLTWSIWPRMSRPLKAPLISLLVAIIGAAGLNVAGFYKLYAAGAIATPVPIPFSLMVMLALSTILRAVMLPPSPRRLPTSILAFLAAALAFPLAQIALYGPTDYRRPADAIIVFGARAYRDGSPSDALEDRVLTGIELYHQGLARRLIFSGGPGDGAISEAQAMRRYALARGVLDDAIVLDERGLNTDSTVINARELLGDSRPRVLAVSHAWHLPRVKLRFEREGLAAFTVPADQRGQMLRNTPYLVAREVAALWVYYLRAVAG